MTMTFDIPTDMDQITEDKPVAPGRYDVRIKSAEGKKSAKGNPIILCFLEILDAPEGAAEPMYCVNIPYEGCHKLLKQEFKRFIITFNVDVSGGTIDVNSLPGLEANIILDDDVNQDGKPVNRPVMNPIPG